MTHLHLRLDNFEGPLDLLLHLIEQDELDIYDIPVGRVTEQYLQYLADIDSVDMDRAGEFLVMAATLCQIKARMLLPRPVVETDESLVPGMEPGDPRAELVLRLLEYSRFKQAAGLLETMAAARDASFSRWQEGDRPELEPIEVSPAGETTLADLLVAWQMLLDRRRPPPVRDIAREPVTVAECMERIRQAVAENRHGVTFVQLFPPTATRQELVATFLALLELLRLREITAWQEGPLADIHILGWGERPAS